MRAEIACVLICVATGAQAADTIELPSYFSESFELVAERPLTILSGARLVTGAISSSATGAALPGIIVAGTSGPSERAVLRPTAAAYASLSPTIDVTPPAADDVPLPVRRPKGIDVPLVESAQRMPPIQAPETKVAMLGGQPGAGLAIDALARMEPLAPIAKGSCSVERPYRLTALGPAGRTALQPAATLDLDMVRGLVRWEEGMQAAAEATLGEPIAAIHVAASYHCRTMNHRRRARMSEHGKANAMDVSEFVTASGKRITVRADGKGAGAKAAFIKAVRAATCDVFQVVLGPGSDGMHEDHIHMDLGRWKSCR
jgi:Extensin-like protein C-terminus